MQILTKSKFIKYLLTNLLKFQKKMFEESHIFFIIAIIINFLTRIYHLKRLTKIEQEEIPRI